jgi:futalosine hydrolase
VRILVVASSNREVMEFTGKFEFIHQIEPHFRSYKWGDMNVDVLITGFAGVFTAYLLTRAINMINYDLAINIGLAGSFDHFLEQGFVVNVVQDQFADLGLEHKSKIYTLYEEELMDENDFPFAEGVLNSLGNFEIEEVESLIPVKGITLNTLYTDPKWINIMRDKYSPEIETMNGAAFFYVCLSEKVPFLQIRAISHFVEIRKIENWNIPSALKNLSASLISILDELKMD